MVRVDVDVDDSLLKTLKTAKLALAHDIARKHHA